MNDEKPSLKHVRVFGWATYVLRLPRGTKFESRAFEAIYLKTMDHGVYKLLVTGKDVIPRVIVSRNIIFDESKVLGASQLHEWCKFF